MTGQANVNLPNVLTVSRILLIPIFVAVFSSPTSTRSLVAATVFLIAALTDVLDGYVARRRSQITTLGRLLDPIADKLLVLSGIILLVQFERVAAWVAIVMIAREVTVTGVRALAASEGIIISAETAGKYKMTAQVIAVLMLIIEDFPFPFGLSLHLLGTGVLYLALLLALISGGRCVLEYWRQVSVKNS